MRRTPNGESGGLSELLKLQENGQFPDVSVKIEDTQIQSVVSQTYCNRRDKDDSVRGVLVVYYEEIKRELNRRRIYECRCDERLKVKLMDLHVSHTLG